MEDSLLHRGTGGASHKSPGFSEIFDPGALEERLKEARARRAVALAKRATFGDMAAPRPAAPMTEPANPLIPPFAQSAAAHADAPASTVESGFERATDDAAPFAPAILPIADSVLGEPPAEPFSLIGPLFRFGQRHLVSIVAVVFIAGIGIGAGLTLVAPPSTTASIAPVDASTVQARPADPAAALPSNAAAPVPPAVPAETVAPATDMAAPAPAPASAASPDAAEVEVALPPAAEGPLAPGALGLAGRPVPRPPVTAETAAFANARVFIHYPRGYGSGRLAALMDGIRAAGFADVNAMRANVDMAAANVRYFHRGDIAAAQALAAAAGGARARDFTFFSPSPSDGTLELWLPGRAAPGQANSAAASGPEAEILRMLKSGTSNN